jgi:purine-binding chemotaxis protein CheW
LTFRWHEEMYAVPLAAVREVARPKRITPVPSGSSPWLGATVLHGDVLPVADVRGMFGLTAERERVPDGCVIVVETTSDAGEPVGLWVDAVCEVAHGAEVDAGRADHPNAAMLMSRARIEDGVEIGVLDLAQVFAAL